MWFTSLLIQKFMIIFLLKMWENEGKGQYCNCY